MPAPDYASEIAALETAMGKGVLRVEQNNGDVVHYQSVGEMQKALSYYRAQASGSSTARRPATTLAAYCPD